MTTQTRYIPITKWPEYHPHPTVPGLRWMVFNAKKTGFSQCICRIGRRVLINEAEFFRWIEVQNGNAPQTIGGA